MPFQKEVRNWSDRSRVVEEPLFKGHIFIQIEDHKRDEVFFFPGTARYLFRLRRPAIFLEEEITMIKKWLGHYNHDRLKVSEMTYWTNVRISCGSFMNKEGILIEISDFRALVIFQEFVIQLNQDINQNELEAVQAK